MSVAEVVERASAALRAHPAVHDVRLVGSHASGTARDLSDVDLLVETDDFDRLSADLPHVVAPLAPLSAQWDRLSEEATYYMLVLPGALKLDLVFDRPPVLPGPWEVTRDTLAAVDAHFWDWLLWLGGKQHAGDDGVVRFTLGVLLPEHLLGPLGAPRPPASLEEAVALFLDARAARERELGVTVDTALQKAVLARLAAAGVVAPR